MDKIRKRNLRRRRRKIVFLGTLSSFLLIVLAAGVYFGVSEVIRYSTGISALKLKKETPEKILAENNEPSTAVISSGVSDANDNDNTDNTDDNDINNTDISDSAINNTEGHTEEIKSTKEDVPIETEEMTSALAWESAAVVSFEPLEKPTYIKIVAVGDNLMHRSVSMSGIRADGSFNYDYNFSKVAPTIQSADLAIINQEVVFGGNELGIQDYPSFNGRTEMADAIVNAGFDVVLAATNHLLDQGVGAALHMIQYFKTNYPQIHLLGVHENWEVRDEVQVAEVNGIRIAMINYTDILNSKADYNGQEYIVDYLDYDRLAGLIAKAKAASDFVIVFPHWGTEYNLGVDAKQQEQVQFLAEQGVDLVIGTHPHVVEPMSYITRPDGEPMLIYYSLGNYQSIQNKEATQIGGMAVVELCKTWRGVSISDFDMKFLANDFRMSPGFRDYYDIVTTYPWEQYTRELADTSWVHHDNPNFNTDYMFQLQAQMQEQVTTERRNAGLE